MLVLPGKIHNLGYFRIGYLVRALREALARLRREQGRAMRSATFWRRSTEPLITRR
jgi:hypothetical protein